MSAWVQPAIVAAASLGVAAWAMPEMPAPRRWVMVFGIVFFTTYFREFLLALPL